MKTDVDAAWDAIAEPASEPVAAPPQDPPPMGPRASRQRSGRYATGYVSLSPPAPGPGEVDRSAPITATWQELRDALATCHYPAIPAWDEAGQARIDRATDRLLAAMGR